MICINWEEEKTTTAENKKALQGQFLSSTLIMQEDPGIVTKFIRSLFNDIRT